MDNWIMNNFVNWLKAADFEKFYQPEELSIINY